MYDGKYYDADLAAGYRSPRGPALLPPRRGGDASGRPDEGARKAGLDTRRHAGGVVRGDGGRGPEPRQALYPAAAVRVYDADAEGVRSNVE